MKWPAAPWGMPAQATGVAVAIAICAMLLYAGKAVVYGPDADNILTPLFFDANRAVARDGVLAAMYNPGVLGGLAQWNSPNFHVLYPLYFNWLGMDGSIDDTQVRLKLVAIMHLSIYGAGCFALTRSLGVRSTTAWATGIAMPFLPAIQSLLAWTAILASMAWLPWVLYFQARLHSGARPMPTIVGLAASAVMLVYAQPAQNLVLAVVGSALLFGSVALVRTRENGWRAARARLLPIAGWCALAGLLILLLAGGYLRAVYQAVSESIRWLGDGGHIVGRQPIPLASLERHALGLRGSFAPIVFSSENTMAVGNLYVGAAMVAAAFGYLVARGRQTMVLAFLAAAAAASVLCFAVFAPAVYHMPVVNKVRELNWWSCLAVTLAFPACVRALQGLADASPSETGDPRLHPRRITVVVLAIAMAAAVGLWLYREEVVPQAIAALFALSVLAVAVWLQTGKRSTFGSSVRKALPILCIVLVVAVPLAAIPRASAGQSLLYTPARIESRMRAAGFARRYPDASSDYRVLVSADVPDYKILVHDLSNAGVRALGGDIHPQSNAKFQMLYFPNQAVARLYGVKYRIVPAEGTDAAPEPQAAGAAVQVDAGALPRLFVVDAGIRIVPSAIAAVIAMPQDSAPAIHVSASELTRKGVSLGGVPGGSLRYRGLAPVSSDAVRTEAVVRTDGSALLVLNEDPGARWRATIGGQWSPALRVNGFQTGFLIPAAGEHVVVIRRPATLAQAIADGPASLR